MQRALASALVHFTVLLTVAACGTTDSLVRPLMAEYNGEVLLRVVDAQGKPVAGAEVLVPSTGYEPSKVSEFLLAGTVGRVDRFGVVHESNERGEVLLRGVAGKLTFIARDPDRWGAATWTSNVGRELSITLAREEPLRVACADAQGRPGTGAFVLVSADNEKDVSQRGGEVVWGREVTSADGTLDVPHAQYWRALQRQGWEVTIAAIVWWTHDLPGGDPSRPFPAVADAPLSFVVAASGWVEVRAGTVFVDAGLGDVMGDLRWLSAPVDPEEPDEVPEISIPAVPSTRMALPLGHRYEVVYAVPGYIDPRIAFDGPKVAGERVEVVVDRLEPAAILTARVVDEQGLPLAGRSCSAWFDRDGARIEAEVDGWSDAEGRMTFELPLGAGGTLHIELSADVVLSSAPLTVRFDSAENRRSASVSVERLEPGETKLGDVVCSPAR